MKKYIRKILVLQAEDRDDLKRLKELGDFFAEEYFYELKLTNKFGIQVLDELDKLERDITSDLEESLNIQSKPTQLSLLIMILIL